MTVDAPAFLADLVSLGVSLSAAGDRLHVEAPIGVLTPQVRSELSALKAELLVLLAPPPPPDPRRLYPFLGKTVMTPRGPGVLKQVFTVRASVLLDSDLKRVAFFHPDQIIIPAEPSR
jgi:hypothetical protein